MRHAMSSLSTQMDSLTKEMRLLRKATERNSMLIELLLYEERLAKVEEKLDAAIMLKTDLDARESDLQRRMKNIQQEVMLRGGLRRDEVEAALKADIQRALEDIKNSPVSSARSHFRVASSSRAAPRSRRGSAQKA